MITNYSTNTNNHDDLMKALGHLDIDEGIKVSAPKQVKKIFINRKASGQFIAQTVKDSNKQSYIDDVITYFDTAKEVMNFLRSEFKSNFAFSLY